MTIESEREPEGYFDADPDYFWHLVFKRKSRLLLRPQRAGIAERFPMYGRHGWWMPTKNVEPLWFLTRAQAAQAANKNFIDSWNRMIRNPEL